LEIDKLVKTSIAMDTIINQVKAHQSGDKDNQLFCIYVAVVKRSTADLH
jgi:F0F1-type ATP synthase alpha subunit